MLTIPKEYPSNLCATLGLLYRNAALDRDCIWSVERRLGGLIIRTGKLSNSVAHCEQYIMQRQRVVVKLELVKNLARSALQNAMVMSEHNV